MTNNQDPELRSLAQKTQATNNEDLHLRALSDKYPIVKNAGRSLLGEKGEPLHEEGTNALIKSEDNLYIRQEEIF